MSDRLKRALRVASVESKEVAETALVNISGWLLGQLTAGKGISTIEIPKARETSDERGTQLDAAIAATHRANLSVEEKIKSAEQAEEILSSILSGIAKVAVTTAMAAL